MHWRLNVTVCGLLATQSLEPIVLTPTRDSWALEGVSVPLVSR
jgi:hypothetical protein